MISVQDFLTQLKSNHILTSEQLANVAKKAANATDAKALAKALLQIGWLTAYQANQLLTGRGDNLLLSSFVLLEKIGQGGMGAVFKARNWKMGRTVAIKLIRKERLAKLQSIRRFHREIRAAAQLQHPNIVAVYDADEVNGAHFMAMEFVQGLDLAQYVKKHGPLPVDKACDCIRQAALGLQHAYECGLVHRDIKPANLFLTDDGVVKLLDMGLARISRTDIDDDTSSLTAEGSIMGTPDYIAPEQAIDAKHVDVRADIYSLGCSLYFLLTGRIPFPGGSVMEKLMRHQTDEPTPIREHRPDVPDEVVAVLRQLMAKKPDDRIQTPYELAEALSFAPVPVQAGSATMDPPPPFGHVDSTEDSPFDFETWQSQEGIVRPSKSDSFVKPKKKHAWIVAGSVGVAGVLLLALVIALFVFFRSHRPPNKTRKNSDKRSLVNPRMQNKPFPVWLKWAKSLPARQKAAAVKQRIYSHNPGFDSTVQFGFQDGKIVKAKINADAIAAHDLSPLTALANLTTLSIQGNGVAPSHFAALKDLPLKSLELINCPVGNFSWVNPFALDVLRLSNCRVTNLSPLRGSNLKELEVSDCALSDLTPLSESKLTYLNISGAAVRDITPLQLVPLEQLIAGRTLISDLSPLTKMTVKTLDIQETPVVDFSPLGSMKKLTHLRISFVAERDTAWLKKLTTVQQINGKSPAAFWKHIAAEREEFQKWRDALAKMPMDEKRRAVEEKLKDLNPGYDYPIQFTHTEKDRVTGVKIGHPRLRDLSPIQALKYLKQLNVSVNGTKSDLMNLWPLKGLPLELLNLNNTRVADLRPLQGMPLTALYITNTPVADLTSLAGMPLRILQCVNTKITDLTPLRDTHLAELGIAGTQISDLQPLANLPLTTLSLHGTKITSLSPLKNLKLTRLNINTTEISDLSPLTGMPLEFLACSQTKVKDLSPLVGMPLTQLQCFDCPIHDISALKGMPLVHLRIQGTSVKDTSVLADMPLTQYYGPIWPFSTLQMLMQHPQLASINGLNKERFHERYGPWHTWTKKVRDLPEEQRSNAVAKKLQELNPEYDGKLENQIENNQLRSLTIKSEHLADLTPLMALPHLTELTLDGNDRQKSRLNNLTLLRWMSLAKLNLQNISAGSIEPLRYLPLTHLTINHAPVTNIEPIGDAPLVELALHMTGVTDLQPIATLKLRALRITGSNIEDVSPLRNMPLETVDVQYSRRLWDLSPLAKLPIRSLNVRSCPILSFEPVKSLPLEDLGISFEYNRDAKWLKEMPTLERINGEPVKAFWQTVEAKQAAFAKWKKLVTPLPAEDRAKAVIAKLIEMNPEFNGQANYSINGGEVREFRFASPALTDITAIGALTDLNYLHIGGHMESFWPIANLKLRMLHFAGCPYINDLRPLTAMPIHYLVCGPLDVPDITPLRGMPLETLHISTSANDTAVLKGMQIKEININFDAERDTAVVKSMPKLERINGMPAGDFWKAQETP